MVRSAFRAGVDDVVAVSADDSEVLGAIFRSMSRVGAQLDAVQRPATVAPQPASTSVGRVVTVFGTKGGMGKSVVAVNLAVALARQMTEPVVLVDASLQFGDVAIMLQLPPEHTITEAVLAGDRLDGGLLEGILLRHKPSGLLVLAAPPDPMSADQIGRPDLLNILTVLRERFAFVVVDTSPRIEDSTLVALQAADDILMLTNLDVMSLKNGRLGLQTLHGLGIQRAKVKLILNRANTQGGLTRADAERAIKMKVATALPSEPLVAESVNRGVPMMLDRADVEVRPLHRRTGPRPESTLTGHLAPAPATTAAPSRTPLVDATVLAASHARADDRRAERRPSGLIRAWTGQDPAPLVRPGRGSRSREHHLGRYTSPTSGAWSICITVLWSSWGDPVGLL